MIVKRNPKLFLSLLVKIQDELQQREDYAAITKELDELSFELNIVERGPAVYELRLQWNYLLEQRHIFENEELNRVYHTQERIYPSDHKGTFHIDQHRSRFKRPRYIMPERERLSNTLFSVAPLRSLEGISAARDLIALLTNSCRVAYQLSLRPRGAKYPMLDCSKDLEG